MIIKDEKVLNILRERFDTLDSKRKELDKKLSKLFTDTGSNYKEIYTEFQRVIIHDSRKLSFIINNYLNKGDIEYPSKNMYQIYVYNVCMEAFLELHRENRSLYKAYLFK